MKTKVEFTNPGSIEVTMTITATVDEWNEVRRRIDAGTYNHAMNQLTSQIISASFEVNKRFPTYGDEATEELRDDR